MPVRIVVILVFSPVSVNGTAADDDDNVLYFMTKWGVIAVGLPEIVSCVKIFESMPIRRST